MASDPNQEIDRNPVEASQGSKRPKLIYVLVVGVVLVVVAFLLVGVFTKR